MERAQKTQSSRFPSCKPTVVVADGRHFTTNEQKTGCKHRRMTVLGETSLEILDCVHDAEHMHGINCGHEAVPHGEHIDYLVGNYLHHQSATRCENHGLLSSAKPFEELFAAITEDSLPWYKDGQCVRFFVMSFLTGGYFFVELIVGLAIGSLALQADAFHMVSDLISLAIGFYSLRATKRCASVTASFGWKRMEVVGALINGVFLLATCFNITLEALHRFLDASEVAETLGGEVDQLLFVAMVGLGINVVGMVIFGHGGHGHSHGSGHGHSHGDHHGCSQSSTAAEDAESGTTQVDFAKNSGTQRNLNVHGVFLHVLGDALGSVGVIVSALIIKYSSSEYRFLADPISSLLIVGIIVAGSWPLVCQCTNILLQMAPQLFDVYAAHDKVLQVPGVLAVPRMHVWQLNQATTVAALRTHINAAEEEWSGWNQTKDRIHTVLKGCGVELVNIEPTFVRDATEVRNIIARRKLEEALLTVNRGANGILSEGQACAAPIEV